MYLRPQSRVFRRKRKLEKVIKLASTGKYSAPSLAKIFNCNKKTIFLVLKDNGIRLKNLGHFPKTVFCNDDFFEILTPLSAYWLGFIAADGTLTFKDKGVSIKLALKDKSHLGKFKRAVQANSKIFYRSATNSVGISVYSGKIFDRLLNLGITPNKSLSIKKVPIPQNLASHFVRGVFDGDGWAGGKKVTHLQFQIAGNEPFLFWIQNFLIEKVGVGKTKIYPLSKETKACRVQYTGSQILRILDFIYQDSTAATRLTRKYEKYLFLKEKFGKK